MEDTKRLDFLVVGSQKSGTSALDKYLREHSDIEMGSQKELHFFDNENNFKRTINYDAYHKHFSTDTSKIKGECTPIYMYWSPSIQRIYEYNPKIKIIAILRNPITRAFSHWNMERDRDADTESFSDAIRNEEIRCKSALPLQHRVYSYTDRGFYSEQIRRIWRFFPREQTLFLKQDDLKTSPQLVLSKISDFLEIRKFVEIEDKDVHSRPYTTILSDNDYKFLRNLYLEEIITIEKMLNWNCSEWKKSSKNPFLKFFNR